MSFSVAQYLKSDLMRQFDTQVNDFMDSLIEESTSLEPAPVPAVFSPPMSDKERSKLRYCSLLCYQMKSCIWCLVTADANALLLPTLVLKRRLLITVFLQALSSSSRWGKAVCKPQIPPRVSWCSLDTLSLVFATVLLKDGLLTSVTPSFVFPHSELFEVNHIRTIYHMFIALLILFILSTLVVDFIDEGR